MAVAGFTIEVDRAFINDAVNDILLAHERLACRHGAAFRSLERAIEDIADNPKDCFDLHWVDGSITVAPSGRLTEALREARRLGVLS